MYKVMPVGVTWPTPTTMRENEAVKIYQKKLTDSIFNNFVYLIIIKVTSLHLVGDGRHALVSVPHVINQYNQSTKFFIIQ